MTRSRQQLSRKPSLVRQRSFAPTRNDTPSPLGRRTLLITFALAFALATQTDLLELRRAAVPRLTNETSSSDTSCPTRSDWQHKDPNPYNPQADHFYGCEPDVSAEENKNGWKNTWKSRKWFEQQGFEQQIDLQHIGRLIHDDPVALFLLQHLPGAKGCFGKEWPEDEGVQYKGLINDVHGYTLKTVATWTQPLFGKTGGQEMIVIALRGAVRVAKWFGYLPEVLALKNGFDKFLSDFSTKLHHWFLVCEFKHTDLSPLYLRLERNRFGIHVTVLPSANAAKYDDIKCTTRENVCPIEQEVTLVSILDKCEKYAVPEEPYNLLTRNCMHFCKGMHEWLLQTLQIPIESPIPIEFVQFQNAKSNMLSNNL